MLAFNIIDHHIEGAMHFMLPLTLLFIADMVVMAYIFIRKNYSPVWMNIVKHIALVLLAYGIFGTLYGFLQMFDALEAIQEDLPRQVIAGGVKVALLNILYGFAYFCILQFGYIILKMLSIRQTSA